MFSMMKGLKPVLAGAAGVMVSAGVAFAAPAPGYDNTQGAQVQPQTVPVRTERYTYTDTETTRTQPAMRYYDNDADYRPATAGIRGGEMATVINPGSIRYLSGGIGHDEQLMLKNAEADYPVKVVFANTNGAFMSDVEVTVKDAAGKTVLGLTTDGPVLLMDLEPGTYTLSADDGSEVKTQKLNVSDSIRSYTLHFKTSEPLGYDPSAG